MDLKRIVAKGLRALLQPPAVTSSQVHKTARVCSGTQVNFTQIDRYSYIGHNGFTLHANIGPFCSIADNCRIGGSNHPMHFVSTSPVFHKGKNIMDKNFSEHNIEQEPETMIGADVWIGANVIVRSGVKIGCGAVVGAGSVVTHDIPPYEIWAGVPARKIKDRFEKSVVDGLLKSQWWEWNDEKLEEYSSFFNDPVSFLSALEGKE